MFVARERSADVVISGQANLIDDAIAQDNARELLRTLEDKETLIRLLDRTRHAEGLQVFLGAETALSALALADHNPAEERCCPTERPCWNSSPPAEPAHP